MLLTNFEARAILFLSAADVRWKIECYIQIYIYIYMHIYIYIYLLLIYKVIPSI